MGQRVNFRNMVGLAPQPAAKLFCLDHRRTFEAPSRKGIPKQAIGEREGQLAFNGGECEKLKVILGQCERILEIVGHGHR